MTETPTEFLERIRRALPGRDGTPGGPPGPVGPPGPTGAAGPSEFTSVLLAADFNIDGAADTLIDVTGMSFAVVNGRTYYFRFVGVFLSGAGTNGSRWSVNGPTVTYLAYRSEYGLTATSTTVNQMLTAVDQPAAANASSGAAANLVLLEGMFQPSADGTFIIRAAREVNTSVHVLQAGAALFHKHVAS